MNDEPYARRYISLPGGKASIEQVLIDDKWVDVNRLPVLSMDLKFDLDLVLDTTKFAGPMTSVIDAMNGLGLAARKAEESMAGPVSRQRKAAQAMNVPIAGKPRSPRRLHGFKPHSTTNQYGMIFEDPERCATCGAGPQSRAHQVPAATRKPDLGYSVMDRVLVHVQPGALNAADEWELGTVVDVEGAFDDGPGGKAKILLDSQTTPGVPADVSVANWYVCNNAIKRAPVVPRFATPEEADAWLEAQSEAGRADGEAPVDNLIAYDGTAIGFTGRGIAPNAGQLWALGGAAVGGAPGVIAHNGPYTAKLTAGQAYAPLSPVFSARLQDAAGYRGRWFPLSIAGQGAAGPELSGIYVADHTDVGRTFSEVVGFADNGAGPVELKTATLAAPCTLSAIGDTISVTIS